MAVTQHNVANNSEYVLRKQEVQQRAERAYRMEKTALCMQNEIKKLSVAYEELHGQYEAKKDAFISAADDDHTDERDRLIDRMMQNAFVNGSMTIGGGALRNTTPTLEYHLKQAAYYFNEHHTRYGVHSRILSTESLLGGSIPDGDAITTMNSPLYDYLNMTRIHNSVISPNVHIQQYINSFLKAEDWDNKYDNLSIKYAGTYQVYKAIKKRYDYLWNKRINIGFRKIRPFRWMARLLLPALLLSHKVLSVVYKDVQEADANRKRHTKNADHAAAAVR